MSVGSLFMTGKSYGAIGKLIFTIYCRKKNALSCVRDFDHKKYWVLGAFIGSLVVIKLNICMHICRRQQITISITVCIWN